MKARIRKIPGEGSKGDPRKGKRLQIIAPGNVSGEGIQRIPTDYCYRESRPGMFLGKRLQRIATETRARGIA